MNEWIMEDTWDIKRVLEIQGDAHVKVEIQSLCYGNKILHVCGDNELPFFIFLIYNEQCPSCFIKKYSSIPLSSQHNDVHVMNSFTNENWPVFVKTDKTGLVWFCQFIKIRPVEFEILKNLK
jgi:hypothetical protein